MAGSVVSPVLPDIKEQLNINDVLVGNLVTMHCLTIALFSPFLGILADKISPVRVLIPSLAFYGLFGSSGALMHSFWPLLGTRALLGVASGGIAAGSLGLLGQMYDGEKRAQAIGYATATLTITGIIFPLLGGFVGAQNWQFTFYLYVIGIPLAVLAALLFSSQRLSSSGNQSPGLDNNFGEILNNPNILRLLITLILASMVMYAVVIYTPEYLRDTLNISTVLNGVVLASRALGAAVISAFGAKPIAQTIGRDGSIGLGFGLMALTLITIPVLNQFHLILIAAICFGIGFGLVLPNLYSSLANIAPSHMRSSLLAAGTGAGFLGQFLSPILLGPILGIGGLELVFYTAAGIAMIAGLLLLFSKHLTR